jgi:hypothetical protein
MENKCKYCLNCLKINLLYTNSINSSAICSANSTTLACSKFVNIATQMPCGRWPSFAVAHFVVGLISNTVVPPVAPPANYMFWNN